MSLFPNDNLRRRSDFPGDSCGKCDRLAELERENEALRKDAERYRWLRAQDYVVASKHPAELLVFGTDGVLDAAIDTALEEQSKC